MLDDTKGGNSEEEAIYDELDPHIMEANSQIAPMEELKSFSADPQNPTKALQVIRDLPHKAKEKLKNFL